MKLLDTEAKLLTNDELRAVLAEEVAACQREGQVPTHLKQLEESLEQRGAGATTEQIRQFIEAVNPLGLVKAELLQLVNLKPTLLVEVFLIIEDCEDRLGEERAGEVLEAVKCFLL